MSRQEKVVNRPMHFILTQEGDVVGSLQEAVVWDVVVIIISKTD